MSARALIAHQEGMRPGVELTLATKTINHARQVLGFLRSNPSAGTETSRRKIRRAYSWLLALGIRHRAHAIAAASPWPSSWLSQAMCIHAHEGAWNDDTGNGYGGGMQFLVSTWNNAAGRSGGRIPYVSSTGAIARMPVSTQLLAAYVIWRADGGSWREWGTAGDCGL